MTEETDKIRRRNAGAVRAMYACERTRDLERWITLWHPAGRQTFPFGGSDEVVGHEALRTTMARKFAQRSDVSIDDQIWGMADPQWVFAITKVRMQVVGFTRPFEVDLWCRFRFDPQGLILEQQEVFDTRRIDELTQGAGSGGPR